MPKRPCCFALAVLAGLAGVGTAVPLRAAVTLTDGLAVPGLEPTPGEGMSRPGMPQAGRPAVEWVWYRVSAQGLRQEPPVAAALTVADLAELIATEFPVASLPAEAGVATSEADAVIRASGAGRHGGAMELWPVDVSEREDLTLIGMRVGRAGRVPPGPKTAALSPPGGGLLTGRVVWRRRTGRPGRLT